MTERVDPASIAWPGEIPVNAETWDTWMRWARAWTTERPSYLAESSWRVRAPQLAAGVRAELGLPTEGATAGEVAETYEATVERIRALVGGGR